MKLGSGGSERREAVSETRTEQQSLFYVDSSDRSDNLDSSVGSVEGDEDAEYLIAEREGLQQEAD